jgi:hypothetical protein
MTSHTLNGTTYMLKVGYVNLYEYGNGRLHAGTGIYANKQVAIDKAKRKSKLVVAGCSVYFNDTLFELSPEGDAWYRKKEKGDK